MAKNWQSRGEHCCQQCGEYKSVVHLDESLSHGRSRLECF
jgi:hypothetical protein